VREKKANALLLFRLFWFLSLISLLEEIHLSETIKKDLSEVLMSSIYNRSSHPVEIKKISIRLWSLRDEIEAALVRRIKECEAAGIPLYIDDIKKFYNLNPSETLAEQANVLKLHPGGATENAEAADEGMAEFMAALTQLLSRPIRFLQNKKSTEWPILKTPFLIALSFVKLPI
jgi:hypothetical protein